MIHFQPLIAALLLLFSVGNGASISYDEITVGDPIKLDGLKKEARHGNLSLSEDYLSRNDGDVISFVSRTSPKARFSDTTNLNRFQSQPGASITYNAALGSDDSDHLELVQATEGTVLVTVASFAARLGSRNYQNISPPGWSYMLSRVNNDISSVHRGHLVPNILGGSGSDVHNIVAMFRMVNSRHLLIWESMVRDVFQNGLITSPECIEYRCRAEYRTAGRESPSHIRASSWFISGTSRTAWFDLTIPNEPDQQGTDSTIHWDNTASLFPSLDSRGRP